MGVVKVGVAKCTAHAHNNVDVHGRVLACESDRDREGRRMALRQLVEGDCGAANPLVQWSSHFSQQKPLAQGRVHHDRLREIAVSCELAEPT